MPTRTLPWHSPRAISIVFILLSFYNLGNVLVQSAGESGSRRVSPCDQWDVCSQFCQEAKEDGPNNVTCSCLDAFHLGEDNRSCIPNDQKVKVVYALKNSIRIVNANRSRSSSGGKVFDKMGQPVGVTVDVGGGFVYWTDATDGKESIHRTKVDGDGQAETIVDTGLLLPEGIAFDWITGNIYIADSNRSQIIVCRGDGSMCTVLVRELMMDKPREVALHPSQGLMFWTDWGEQSSIMRANMDGSLALPIVSENLKWPNSLAVDHGRNRLYWADAFHDKFETSSLTGTDRQLVNMDRVKHPFSLEVFGDTMFWTDWELKQILSCTKFACKSDLRAVVEGSISPNGLAIFHPAAQPRVKSNPCQSKCSHICLLSGKSGYSCKCPAGWKLDRAGKNCIDDESKPKMLIGHDNYIKLFRFDSIGRDIDLVEETKLPDLKNIGALAYNPVNNSVFISDLLFKTIYEYSFDTKGTKIITNRHVDSVKSLSFDPVGENLYWVDSSRRKVEVMSCRTRAKALISQETDYPQSIIVVPEERYLFVAVGGRRGGRILRMNMNGYNRKTIVRTNRGDPTSLTYNAELKRVFWIDGSKDSIEHVGINGLSQATADRPAATPFGMTSFGNRLFWSDRHTQKMHSLTVFGSGQLKESPIFIGHPDDKVSNGTVESYVLGNFLASLTIMQRDMRVYENLTLHHECSSSRSTKKCSHICLFSAEVDIGTCACPDGMGLNPDGTTCSWTTSCLKDQFQCNDKRCIDKDWKCDKYVDCDGGEDEKGCETVNPCTGKNDFMCSSDKTCIHIRWKCDGERNCPNGEDEMNCDGHTCAPGTEFKCNDGKCIPMSWKCDHQFDCHNGEDEIGCNQTCPIGTFQCSSKDTECISIDWVCDGQRDCADGSDEHGHCEVPCTSTAFRCLNHHCIEGHLACNGFYDCADHSDEFDCGDPHRVNSTSPTPKRGGRVGEPQEATRTGSTAGWWVFGVFLIVFMVGGAVGFVFHRKRIHPKVLFERYAHHIPVKFNIRRSEGRCRPGSGGVGDEETYQDFTDGHRSSSDVAGLLSNIDAAL